MCQSDYEYPSWWENQKGMSIPEKVQYRIDEEENSRNESLDHLENVKRSLKYLKRNTALSDYNSRMVDCLNHLESNLQLLEECLTNEH